MKTRKLLILGLIPAMLSCGGSEEADTDNDEDGEDVAENCTYTYDPSSTVLTWTAFKTSEKLAVDGSFDQMTVTTKESNDMFAVFAGAAFEIPVNSLNTQDPVRDGKLKSSFFGNLNETEMITGTIVSLNKTTAAVKITMNAITVEYEGAVTVDGETITMEIVMDIMDFEGGIAMDSLSLVCAEKHTGEDGTNKFWSDVSIAAKTTLKKDCPVQ